MITARELELLGKVADLEARNLNLVALVEYYQHIPKLTPTKIMLMIAVALVNVGLTLWFWQATLVFPSILVACVAPFFGAMAVLFRFKTKV